MEQWFNLLVVMHGIGLTAGIFNYGPSDIETVLTRKGMAYVSKALVDRIVNISVAGEGAFGGSFKYESKTTGWTAQVSGLQVHDIRVPTPELEVSPSDGIKFKVEKMSFKMDFNYSEFTHSATPGSYSVQADDIEVELYVKMNPDKPVLSSVTCSATINDMTRVSGDRILFNIFLTSVWESLEDAVCEEAKKRIDVTHITSVLSMLDLKQHNVRFSDSQFKFENDTISSYHNLTGNVDAPTKKMVLPLDKMIGFGVTEKAVRKVFLRSDTTGGKRRHIFKGWSQLKKAFGLNWDKAHAPFEMSVDLHCPPTFSFVTGGASINLNGNVTFRSSKSSSEANHVIDFHCLMFFKLGLARDNKRVRMDLRGVHFFDTTGKMDYQEVNEVINFALKKYAPPLKFMIPLPLYEGVMLVNAMLNPYEGLATVSSDFEWIRRG